MATTQISFSDPALVKSIAHILKYQKHDCIGLLLGSKDGTDVRVNDVIPLFHDRIMTSSTEIAFEMVQALYEGDENKQLVGVYDAPLKFRGADGKALPISSLGLSLAEQIKTK